MDLTKLSPPADVIRLVLKYLEADVLSCVAQVCKKWTVYSDNYELWQALCERDGFVDPDLHHSIVNADAIDWRQLYIEKYQYIAHDTEEAMYEMFEELQNKYILSESQNEQLVLQLNQLIGELTAVKKGYRHLEKKMVHYNTLQSKYIILKERYKALEKRLQEVEVGASIRSQQMSELKEQMNLKERKYKKLKEKYLEKRQELKNNGLSNSSSTNKISRSILDSSSAVDESKYRTRGRTGTVGSPLDSSTAPITIEANGRVKTVKVRMPESPTQGAMFESADNTEGSLADHVLDSEEELMEQISGNNEDESMSRSRSYSMSDAHRPAVPLPFITQSHNNNTNASASNDYSASPAKSKTNRARNSSVNSDGSDDKKGASATPLAGSTSRITVMKSPRGETNAKIPTDIAVMSQVPMPTALWHVDFEELHFSEKIGMGAAATVYRGTYRDQTVAIKILRTGESLTEEKDLDDFRKELEILKTLRAANIVTFIGATLEPRLCMVLEYCSRGSLHSFLKDVSKDLTWELFFKWATQCIKGVQVLHQFEPQIVHRDLKTPNLLIDNDMNLKVCDFGLSRFITGDKNNKTTLAKFRGTYCYMATEIYAKEQYSPKSDIYSLGVILWEMIHKCLIGSYEKPYAEYKFIRYDIQIPVQAATKNLRPTIPITCPEMISQVIRACWDSDPMRRPSSGILLQRFEQIKKEYENNAKNWDRLREFAKKKYSEKL